MWSGVVRLSGLSPAIVKAKNTPIRESVAELKNGQLALVAACHPQHDVGGSKLIMWLLHLFGHLLGSWVFNSIVFGIK